MRLPNGQVRKLRRSSEDPGCAHELTFSCYHRLPLLSRDRTRQWLLESLDQARRKRDLELWAYVIMPEHVHVLFLPRDPQYRVRTILQTIKQPVMRRAINYLQEHNPGWLDRLRSQPEGSPRFWQPGGGYDRNIDYAATAWSVVDYIHNNPVRKELASCPTDWVWSSARWYAGLDGVVLPMDATPPRR